MMKHLKILFLVFISLKLVTSLHFDLSVENKRCYIEELFNGSVAVIKYKIWSNDNNIDHIKNLIHNIHISVSTEQNELLQLETAKGLKGKFSFLSKDTGFYFVCVEKTNVYWGDKAPFYVKIKIMSDNMDEPNISKAIKTQDLDPVKDNFAKITKKGERIVSNQENELEHEDAAARQQMEYIKYYYYMAVSQVVIIVIVGLYQLFSFRSFIKNNE